ncbi:MAG: Phospholipase C [Vezdaea aestivalis]|nr:MAG: Phospholipase C [Vezdaea aestivalis]
MVSSTTPAHVTGLVPDILPSKQLIDTDIPLTITPASAVSKSNSFTSMSSQRLVLSPSDSETNDTNPSSLPSPEGPRGRILKSQPPPSLLLPDPIVPPAPIPGHQNAMSEAIAITKGQSLMRRLSGKATNKLSRRRTSSTNLNRDRSSGPAVLRRRSDSNGGFDNTQSPAEESEEEAEESEDGRPGVRRSQTSTLPRLGGPMGSNIAIGPVVPVVLQKGTKLIKVTRKKRKELKFALDIGSAKMYWDPSRASKSFYVDDIRELRFGPDASNYRKEFGVSEDFESTWFTIVYADASNSKGRTIKTMHLVAPSQAVFQLWVNTLESVSKYRFDMMTSLANGGESSLKAHWHNAITKKRVTSADAEEKLAFEEVEDICRSLHIDCPRSFLKEQFARADETRDGRLSLDEFRSFVRHVKERKDVQHIFEATAANFEAGLELSEFLAFLQDVQGVDIDAEPLYWETVFEKLARRSKLAKSATASPIEKENTRMGLAGFAAFLSSRQYNSPLNSSPKDITLDCPLNEYFISSSHNTYLLGRQVAGESSTEPYIRALQRGCRCVEIDCWDGPDGRPVVTHGRTLTKIILFQDVINVIEKYAFVQSPYPLIISLEVHCNAEQQATMADIMRARFGEKLILEPFMTNVMKLPSPEELRNRILIKVKASEDTESVALLEDLSINRQHRALSSPLSRPVLVDNASIPSIPLVTSPQSKGKVSRSSTMRNNGGTSMSTSSATTDESDSKEYLNQPERKAKSRKTKIAKPLGDLGVYTRGFKFSHFHHPNTKLYNHVYSLAERTFDSLCRDAETKVALEKHNMRYLMRVYPSAFRIQSSNFNPIQFWRRGVQAAALNWQTYDLGMQLNDAMFDAGIDRSGYVLKPIELRRSRAYTEPFTDGLDSHPKKQRKLVKFSVDIISGQQLPRANNLRPEDSICPYIEVETFGADEKGESAGRTGIVETRGYNPVFNEKISIAVETKFPSLLFVRFTVYNALDSKTYGDRNAPLATFTAKLDKLRAGYHHMPLRNANGEEYLFSTLFCRFQKETTQLVEREDARSGKVQSLRQLGRSVLNRTLSIERKSSTRSERSDRSTDQLDRSLRSAPLEATSEEASLYSVETARSTKVSLSQS